MTSYPIKLYRENDDGFLVLTNGKVGALRKYPFSVNSYVLSSISGHNGAYQVASLTASGTYKLFTGDSLSNLTEDTSWGGDNGIYINADDNNWTYDGINSVYSTNASNNVLIGLTGANANKFAVYGNTSVTGNSQITGNLSVQGTLSAGALHFVSTTAQVAEISLTSQALNFLGSVSITGDGIPPIENHLLKVHQPNNSIPAFLVASGGDVNVANNISASAYKLPNADTDIPVISYDEDTNYVTISSSYKQDANLKLLGYNENIQLLLSDGGIFFNGGYVGFDDSIEVGQNATIHGSLNVNGNIICSSLSSLTSNLSSLTASLTGATILSKTGTQVYLTTPTDNLRLGNSTLTGMKLDVQGLTNIGNTTTYGVNSEKGRITWGGTPQSFNMFALSTLNLGLGVANIGEVITVASGGNVGISTTTPQRLLDISATQPIVRLTNTTNLGTTAWANTEIGKIEFYSADLSQPSVVANISSIGSADSSGGVANGDLAFFTKNQTGSLTEKFRINDLGHVSLTGGIINSNYTNHSVTSTLLNGQSATYNKGANHIIAYNDAGTIKYRHLVLTGTDANWIYTTTAP